jgi:O-antigen/teichoic acid export membrane protein
MSKHRTFGSAVKWSYAKNWGEKGLTALFTFVLASLLGPRDFGTVAMAMIYISFIQMFLDQGLVAALIQRKDLQREHLDSVFWLDVVLCLFLMGFSIALSPWWARVNHLPELSRVISVLSVCILLEGLDVVQRAVLQREMDFKNLFLRSNLSVVVGGIVGLGMAFRGFGVWSIVGQRISQDLVALVTLWSLSHWRPGWRFSRQGLRDLLGFSTSSFVGKLGTFANNQADALLLGIFFGPIAVGLYRLAHRLMTTVLDTTTNSLQVISLPEFSRNQDRPDDLRKSVLRCLHMSSILTIPALAGLAALSAPLMATLGTRWLPAAAPLQILCLVGMASSLTNFTGPLMQALGRPLQMSLLTWASTVVSISGLAIAAVFLQGVPISKQVIGIAAVRLLIVAFIAAPVFLLVLMRMSKLHVREMCATILPALLAASGIAAAIFLLLASGLLAGMRPMFALAASLILGALVGGFLILKLDGEVRQRTFEFIAGLRGNGNAADTPA